MDVEPRHLTTLTAVVDEGSFGKAESRLGYAQSTVSQHIPPSSVRSVAASSTARAARARVQLTPLGEVIPAHAARVARELD